MSDDAVVRMSRMVVLVGLLLLLRVMTVVAVLLLLWRLLWLLMRVMELLRLELGRKVHMHAKSSTARPAIHQGMLPRLVTLIEHAEDVMRR